MCVDWKKEWTFNVIFTKSLNLSGLFLWFKNPFQKLRSRGKMYSQCNVPLYVYIWEAQMMATTILQLPCSSVFWTSQNSGYLITLLGTARKRHSLLTVLIDSYHLDGACLTRLEGYQGWTTKSKHNSLCCPIWSQMVTILLKHFQSVRYLYCRSVDARNGSQPQGQKVSAREAETCYLNYSG